MAVLGSKKILEATLMPKLKQREGRAKFGAYETWYRITGDLDSKKPPLFILHGGPGAAHNYCDAFKHIAKTGRAVIHYDQVGCGKSTHLPKKGKDFWTVQLFIDELDNLVDHLGQRKQFHILGQSWGGMLGAEYGTRRPKGLKSITIANSPASMKLWMSEALRMRGLMPPEIQAALYKHEKTKNYGHKDYQAATKWIYDRHVCRIVPNPKEVTASFEQLGKDPTVYYTMNGPNEFFVVGTLKKWNVIPRLHKINVPTYVYSGYYDEATPACVQPFKDKIKGAVGEFYYDSSHMPHVEEHDLCMKNVGAFLAKHDK
jgi:L-proline amide hydrolase